MSYQDIIRKILRKHGELSTEDIHASLVKEYDFHKSSATVRRTLREMQKEGTVRAVSFGREQRYKLTKQEPTAISEFFLNKFWNELFRIREDIAYHDYPAEAFVKLRSLVRMLPERLKRKVMPKIDKLGSTLDKNRGDYGLDDNRKITSFSQEVERLLDEVSSLLHKELKLDESS